MAATSYTVSLQPLYCVWIVDDWLYAQAIQLFYSLASCQRAPHWAVNKSVPQRFTHGKKNELHMTKEVTWLKRMPKQCLCHQQEVVVVASAGW